MPTPEGGGGTDLAGRVLEHVHRAGLFDRPGLALLAVSGGPDSVALLDLMQVLAPALELEIAVVHVDHGILRTSDRVARDVRQLADRVGVVFHAQALHLGPNASETVARRARYEALRATQRRLGAAYLVTAHHADDQVETVLFRVLRGSGVAGLAGISDKGADGLVRPLLPFTKTELGSWLAARFGGAGGLPVFYDPANGDPRHDRSWLRACVLPVLRNRFGPSVDDRVLELASHAGRDRLAWSQLVTSLPELEFAAGDGGVEVARAPFQRYHNVLSEAILRAVAREVGCVIGAKRAARLSHFVRTAASGRRLELGGPWEAEAVFDRLRISSRTGITVLRSPDPLSFGETPTGRGRWNGWDFRWRHEPASEMVRNATVTWIGAGPALVRALEPGDRIFPLGGVGHRKVRRMLMEARVPARARSAYPVVVRDGIVLWIPGVCRSIDSLPRAGEPAMRVEARDDRRPDAGRA